MMSINPQPAHTSPIRRLPPLSHFTAALTAILITISAGYAAEEPLPATPSPPTPTAPAAIPSYRQASQIAVLRIEGVIDGVTLRSLERRIKQAQNDGADAIVLDIDTPGGELLSTLDICNLLKDRTETPANLVAWIHPKAYSAGTIIALACREIVVSPNASFGDAAPIQISPFVGLMQMEKTERAKMEAPILTEVIDSARRNHYDENLVTAFISVGIELWLIENTTTGHNIFVNPEEYEQIFGEPPPAQMSSVTPPASAQPVSPRASSLHQQITGSPTKPSDENALTPEQIAKEIQIAQSLPPWQELPTADERDQWKLLGQVISNDRLLTIKPAEALFYGLATQTIANDAELAAYFGASPSSIIRYDRSWSESLVRNLVSWPVRGVLIVIFLIALFIELAAPGMGVFGATALIALLLLIGAPYLAGMAQWWDILLVIVGIGLIAAELFVIPGFGVAGLAGAACLLIGMVGTFVSGDIGSTQGQNQILTGLMTTFLSLFVAGVSIWVLSRWFHSFSIFRRLILATELRSSHDLGGFPSTANAHAREAEGIVSGAGNSGGGGLIEAMGRPQHALAPGDPGIAHTDLRPAGRANFHGRIVDVQSLGSYIEKGRPIRVYSVGRYVIEVEENET